jgi:catechol 2,3-dioxygenase-like lactoylglutathione lyase family enzyme
MLSIRCIDHVVYRVTDLERVARFWTEVLGATLEKVQPEIGLHQYRVGEALVDLVPVDGPLGRQGGAAPSAEGHNVDHVAFRLDPWDSAQVLAHLAAHGIETRIVSRYGAAGQGPSAYLHDPEGNRIELRGPAWPGETSR